MGQSRHQPSVPPINQSPGIRAQVPHQFLSPQVHKACHLLVYASLMTCVSLGVETGSDWVNSLYSCTVSHLNCLFATKQQKKSFNILLLESTQRRKGSQHFVANVCLQSVLACSKSENGEEQIIQIHHVLIFQMRDLMSLFHI